MKSFMKTGMVLFTILTLSFFSCKQKGDPFVVDPAFAAHVISFTSGVVSSASSIEVRLVQEVADAQPGKELSSNPFDFSPGLKGKATWVDKQTIRFTPKSKLESGQMYEAEFALSDFAEVPKELKTLKFRFQVMKQYIRYEFEGISPQTENDPQLQQVHGVFTTADVVEKSAFEEIVTISGSKKNQIRWKHSNDGRTHRFTVENVARKQNAYSISLAWDGSKIGATDGESSFQMPGINQFVVMHVKTTSTPQASVSVYFSDPLSKMQDIDGLFRLSSGTNLGTLIQGNEVRLIPTESVTGTVYLTVFGNIRNYKEQTIGKNFVWPLKFVSLKPQVEMIGEGVIVPNSDGIRIPFRAVSLSAVEVRIIKIFENNIIQFLQVNQPDGNNEIKRVGRVVYSGEIQLTSDDPIDYASWNNFSLDLSKLVETEPGAIYRVEIGFSKKHSLYPCGSKDSKQDEEYSEPADPNEGYNEPAGYWGYYDDEGDYDYEVYNWEEQDDPCKPSYYMGNNRKAARNVLASDLGIIAKAGTDNEYHVVVNDLRDTEPIKGTEIEFRNLQNQVIGKVTTGSDGFASIRLTDKPFVLIASKDKQRGYLRLDNASSLSLSMFDVSGEELKKGIKGFIYGERAVWRPGDQIFLTFILQDKNKSLPASQPVILELFTPSGQLAHRMVKNQQVKGFYSFHLKTPAAAPTGNWQAKITVGGSVFSKNLRIETVKPNRLKIKIEYEGSIFHKNIPLAGKIQVNWLHGAPASGKIVKIEATMAGTKTEFKGYTGYSFDDPAKKATSQDFTVFNGSLDADGNASLSTRFNYETDAPGMLAVQLKTTAMEGGGDFSTDRFVMKYSPFKQYAGIKMPPGKGWNDALYADENNAVQLALVDENGRPMNGEVKVEVYELYWRWWWEQSSDDNLASFISNSNSRKIKTDYAEVRSGKGIYTLNFGKESSGRKLIRVTDMSSGHSAGAIFYTSYKNWWSNAGNENPGGAEMLMFKTDKETYKVGEKVSVELPVTHEGVAIVSIETGSRVLQFFRVEPSGLKPGFKFEVTPEMAPNIYVHVSYIQPHNHGKNDYPIRMYGVQAVKVEDPDTHLAPRINMQPELKPLQKFTVKVDETNGKAMTYTLAIVDEGLLDLTRFKTPNPRDGFYAHEALGVRTWDLYKYVAGTFSGRIAGLYAVGGDQYFDRKGKENNNRFKPVVLFSSPVSIKARGSNTHTFTMPNYVGSVRVMVIAGNEEGAFGSAEKTVPVKQSLMVLPTIPRVVGPSEEIKIPVTVFAMDNKARNVTVKITVSGHFSITDSQVKTLTFDKPGEKMTEFSLKVKNTIGEGKIHISATSGNVSSTSDTDLKIRLPNPPAANVKLIELEPGKSISQTISALGIPGTNSGAVEISAFYPLNIEKRMKYLVQYPHGCVEQIVSAAFPQLYLSSLMSLGQEKKAETEQNIKSCLEKLKQYQVTNGGFAYWPGNDLWVSAWGTSYAGHFMLEAKSKGYDLPVNMLSQWLAYQTREANDWKPTRRNYGTDLDQAYRLYTLALAQKPALSAMNLMRETSDIDPAAKWRLAAAYAVAGKPETATQLIQGLNAKAEVRDEYPGTFGSVSRDNALLLEAMVAMGKKAEASVLAQDIAGVLSSGEWLSTQSTAYMLLAMAKYAGTQRSAENLQAQMTIQGKAVAVNTEKMLFRQALDFSKTNQAQIIIKNTSGRKQFVVINQQGVPLTSGQEEQAENLRMQVSYTDAAGNAINPLSIKQGTQFTARITVQHPGIRLGYENLALSAMFPSGWEILNTRLDDITSAAASGDQADYSDIRDDRVYLYFNLKSGAVRTFKILLQAAYPGKFYLPSVQCEGMYDNTIRAYTAGKWIEVVK